MGKEYGPAVDMFVNRERVFIDALQPVKNPTVVIHGSGSPSVPNGIELGGYFATNAAMVSSHFAVDRQGAVYQYVSLSDGACANCCVEQDYDPYWNSCLKVNSNLNFCTISIEHCNTIDNSLPLTTAQQDASFALIKWLCVKYHLTRANVKGHNSIAPHSRGLCPGNYPWNDLTTFLNGALTQPLANPQAPSLAQVEKDVATVQAELRQVEQEIAQITQH